MSRHEILAIDPKAHKVIVGWDHPLMTFFAQVYDRSKGDQDNNIILWVGGRYMDVYEIEQLENKLRRYAALSHDIKMKLYGDKDDGR